MLSIGLIVFTIFTVAPNAFGSSLQLNTTEGASLYIDGKEIPPSNDDGNQFLILPNTLPDSGNVVHASLSASNHRSRHFTLSKEIISNAQTMDMYLTPLPLWLVWKNEIFGTSILLACLFIGFIISRRVIKRNRHQEKPVDEKSNTPAPEDKINQYLLLDHIASGGISQIFRAKDADDNTVALKVMTNYLDDEDLKSKFIGEGMVITNINSRSPDAPVVKVFDYGYEDDDRSKRPFIAMELIEGTSLKNHIDQGSLSHDQKIKIIVQLIEALHATHSLDTLHRDIAPDNVILRDDSDSEISLIDFGVAKHEVQWLKGKSYGAAYGKPEYMSPEQFDGSSDIDYRSDYYSLGVLIYALFCGSPPFQDTNIFKVGEMHKAEALPPISRDVPPNIRIMIVHLMEKDPEKRPGSPSEIKSYLNLNQL